MNKKKLWFLVSGVHAKTGKAGVLCGFEGCDFVTIIRDNGGYGTTTLVHLETKHGLIYEEVRKQSLAQGRRPLTLQATEEHQKMLLFCQWAVSHNVAPHAFADPLWQKIVREAPGCTLLPTGKKTYVSARAAYAEHHGSNELFGAGLFWVGAGGHFVEMGRSCDLTPSSPDLLFVFLEESSRFELKEAAKDLKTQVSSH